MRNLMISGLLAIAEALIDDDSAVQAVPASINVDVIAAAITT